MGTLSLRMDHQSPVWIAHWAFAVNDFNLELNNLNFHPLEVVARYRDRQLQVGENY